MSFRHTFITEFLYKGGHAMDLKMIRTVLEIYSGNVKWEETGMPGLGYFHGVIKDLDGYSTKEIGGEIKKALENLGVELEIIFE